MPTERAQVVGVRIFRLAFSDMRDGVGDEPWIAYTLPPATRSDVFTPFRKGRFPLNTELSEFSI